VGGYGPSPLKGFEMSVSLNVPKFLSHKDKAQLILLLLKVQMKVGARVELVSIYFDSDKKEHVLWYRDTSSLGRAI